MGQLRDGDILVGHSLPVTSSLLLERKVKLDEGRFLDFCMLVNALTFHDRLIVLPATVSQEILDSPLYSYLLEKGILWELDFSYRNLLEEHRFEMADLLGDMLSDSEVERLLAIITYSKSQFTGSSVSDENHINFLRSKFIDHVIKIGKSEWTSQSYKLPITDQTEKIYRIRTAEYWEASSQLHIPFLPDFMRIPILSGYNIRLRQSIRMFIENSIDSMVRKELEDAAILVSPLIVPIPNATSTFLHRYYSNGSLEEAFSSMREEFAEDRKWIIAWEEKLRNASNHGFGEMLNIIADIRSSINSTSSTGKTEIAVSIAPGLVDDVMQGFPSPRTSVAAGKALADMIVRWRRRRRIAYFNNGRKEAEEAENQLELLKFAFGSSLTPRQIDRFTALTNYLQRLSYPP
jgi:hypothetical protein